MAYLGAIEAGGTKFRAAIVDPKTLDLIDQVRIPTTTPTETLGSVVDFFRSKDQVDAIGVASFGPLIVDRSSPSYGSFGPTPKPHWSGAPLLQPLVEALGVPIDIETDVESAAVAEQQMGAGKGHKTVAYVTVGTGIGAAISINGVPFRGRDHTELGHIPVKRVNGDDFVGLCPFHTDCLEGMAAGPALAARWGASGDSLADDHQAWDLEAAYLAQLVRVFAYSFVPDVVVFGGGVGTRPGLPERVQVAALTDMAHYSVTHADNPNLVAGAVLGEDAGLIGAALLANRTATMGEIN